MKWFALGFLLFLWCFNTAAATYIIAMMRRQKWTISVESVLFIGLMALIGCYATFRVMVHSAQTLFRSWGWLP